MYATVAQLRAYVEGNPDVTVPDDDAAAVLLASCSRDVDRLLSPEYPPDSITGLKLAPPVAPLTAAQLSALSRAVCAQAAYRLQVGEDEFSIGTDRVLGLPGGVAISPTPWSRYGPRVLEELAGAGLRLRSGTLTPAT